MNFPLWNFSQWGKIQEVQDITGISNIQEVYNTDRNWKIILVDSVENLKNLQLNFFQIKGTEYGNIVVTCKGDKKYDYYMRCFVTDCGINEDPVTGSIECVLAPFWAKRL
jgi:predicted PhzF superfamily epimerase YddE/YHI9